MLLAVTAAAGGPLRVVSHSLPVVPTGQVGFTEMAPEQTGIQLPVPVKPLTSAEPVFVANAGLAAGDYDGDGRCDLFLCSLEGTSTLFRNLGGWKFTNVTAAAGLELEGRVIYGATFADVDGDGDLDLIIVSLTESNSLFLNDGRGNFIEVRDLPWQAQPRGGSITAVLADIEGDGDLDLYVTAYGQKRYQDEMDPALFEQMTREQIERVHAGRPPDPEFDRNFEVLRAKEGGRVDYRVEARGVPDAFYRNLGGGRFEAVMDDALPFQGGAKGPVAYPMQGWGLGATFRDLNGDGAPDLYVCNDFLSSDHFWVNDGHGNYRITGTLDLRHVSRFSMGIDCADLNRDGWPDFLVLDMRSRDHTRQIVRDGSKSTTLIVQGEIDNRPQYMQNALFVNRGDGSFSEIAQFAGLKATGWSWAPVFVDVDLDGYEDVVVTAGVERDFMDVDVGNQIRQMGPLTAEQRARAKLLHPPLPLANQVYRNRGNLTFEDVGARWGVTRSAVSGGAVTADFDNDGDLDVAINNSDRVPEIYRNNTDAPRVAVRLHGRAQNTQGIGARITLLNGAVPMQSAEVICGGIYASGGDPLRVFAGRRNPGGMQLEIRWRNGTVSRVVDVQSNYLYEITEPALH